MFTALKNWAQQDYRSPAAMGAFARLFEGRPPADVLISIGGGPARPATHLINLNIAPFENVDLVGDAHRLPLADASTHAAYIEAVIEHLDHPEKAAAEIFRVLRPGGEVLAITPFMQGYHAYPDHFRNYTLPGHRRLFTEAGFEIVESGACVGPSFALGNALLTYISLYMAGWVGRLIKPLAIFFVLLLRRRDQRLIQHPMAHYFASTTYLVARKP